MKRAERRQLRENKKNRISKWPWMQGYFDARESNVSRLVDNIKLCGKSCCNRPRKRFGITVKEQMADADFRQQKSEMERN